MKNGIQVKSGRIRHSDCSMFFFFFKQGQCARQERSVLINQRKPFKSMSTASSHDIQSWRRNEPWHICPEGSFSRYICWGRPPPHPPEPAFLWGQASCNVCLCRGTARWKSESEAAIKLYQENGPRLRGNNAEQKNYITQNHEITEY